VVKTFGRDFVTDYLQRSARPEFAFLRDADIFSTGHSLGGGLAQQFAYSLPENAGVPRVKKVFAFDPSPASPTIRQVRYNLFYTLNPFAGHSIAEFACKLCTYAKTR
jgi:pimeloyl-ACP methyl ester carboxylesterase